MEWGVASRTRPGEDDCGDLHLVKIDVDQDSILFAVIDGMGKGRSAFLAALITRSVLEQNSKKTISELFQLCHESLKRTKGVGLGIATVDRSTGNVSWAGIGTVEATLIARKGDQTLGVHRLSSESGCVGNGSPLPDLKVDAVPIRKEYVLILNTEGIQNYSAEKVDLNGSSQEIAHSVVAQFWTTKDDALALVARPLG